MLTSTTTAVTKIRATYTIPYTFSRGAATSQMCGHIEDCDTMLQITRGHCKEPGVEPSVNKMTWYISAVS
jgi:hypothetical protein